MEKPLFVIFLTNNMSVKLIEQIKKGLIDAYIFTPPILGLKIKKEFQSQTSPNSFYKIIPQVLPLNISSFHILFTSRNFWDQLPINRKRIFVLFNPKNLSFTINFKNIILQKKPFQLIPLQTKLIISHEIENQPFKIDEMLTEGIFFYVERKLINKVLGRASKKFILSFRKEHKMLNNEHIERLPIIPFYLYFYHYMQFLGWN